MLDSECPKMPDWDGDWVGPVHLTEFCVVRAPDTDTLIVRIDASRYGKRYRVVRRLRPRGRSAVSVGEQVMECVYGAAAVVDGVPNTGRRHDGDVLIIDEAGVTEGWR